MPTVYRRGGSVRFHRTEDCSHLLKGPARGEPQPIVPVDLIELPKMKPCRMCYRDAPFLKVIHRYCWTCRKPTKFPTPCEHNGGVRVTISATTSYFSLLRDPGDEIAKTFYVWPEMVHFYEPLAL